MMKKTKRIFIITATIICSVAIGLTMLLHSPTNISNFELNNNLQLILQEPINNEVYDQIVPLKGVLIDHQGLAENIRIQYRLKNDELYGNWTDNFGWNRKSENTIEIVTQLDFVGSKIGEATIQFRIYNGTVFSNIIEKKVNLKNYFV